MTVSVWGNLSQNMPINVPDLCSDINSELLSTAKLALGMAIIIYMWILLEDPVYHNMEDPRSARLIIRSILFGSLLYLLSKILRLALVVT